MVKLVKIFAVYSTNPADGEKWYFLERSCVEDCRMLFQDYNDSFWETFQTTDTNIIKRATQLTDEWHAYADGNIEHCWCSY